MLFSHYYDYLFSLFSSFNILILSTCSRSPLPPDSSGALRQKNPVGLGPDIAAGVISGGYQGFKRIALLHVRRFKIHSFRRQETFEAIALKSDFEARCVSRTHEIDEGITEEDGSLPFVQKMVNK